MTICGETFDKLFWEAAGFCFSLWELYMFATTSVFWRLPIEKP